MQKILAHTDFDGVVSASLLSIATQIDFIRFVSTAKIWYENLDEKDIVCDLPCPWNCHLWFDHHESNLNEMKARGIDVGKIPGKFEIADSCANIIYNYFNKKIEFPEYFKELVDETDKIDSMNYESIQDWQKETPIKILSDTTRFVNNEDYKSFVNYLIMIAKKLKNQSPEEIINIPLVKERYGQIKIEEKESLETIKKYYYFHPDDLRKEVIIIDLSEIKKPPRIDKNLAYLIEPNALCVFQINSIFKNDVKSNNLKFSAGINFTNKEIKKIKNLSAIFEELEIGGGHKNAAGAVMEFESKDEKLSEKDRTIKKFIKIWLEQ